MRSNLNSVLIEGVLEEDPVLRATPEGAAICGLVIRSNRCYRGSEGEIIEEVSFFEIEARSKLAEACNKHGRKGRGLRAVGRLKEEQRIGADGKQTSKVFIAAENVEWRPEGNYAE